LARRKRKSSATRRWHRLFGAGAALFLTFLVISGLVLNHSHSLGLAKRHLTPSFLLSWYGLGEPKEIRSFELGNDWLSFAGSQVYLNNRAVGTIVDGVAAIAAGGLLVIAGKQELLLFDTQGNLVERQTWSPPGGGTVEALGRKKTGAVLIRSNGELWQADREMLTWNSHEGAENPVQWSTPAKAPDSLRQEITEHYRGDSLSLERFLLDIHSGRFFGPVGVLIYDLIALALGFLAISGLVLWARGRRNGRRNGVRQER
jgi:hypothetical protein